MCPSSSSTTTPPPPPPRLHLADLLRPCVFRLLCCHDNYLYHCAVVMDTEGPWWSLREVLAVRLRQRNDRNRIFIPAGKHNKISRDCLASSGSRYECGKLHFGPESFINSCWKNILPYTSAFWTWFFIDFIGFMSLWLLTCVFAVPNKHYIIISSIVIIILLFVVYYNLFNISACELELSSFLNMTTQRNPKCCIKLKVQ